MTINNTAAIARGQTPRRLSKVVRRSRRNAVLVQLSATRAGEMCENPAA